MRSWRTLRRVLRVPLGPQEMVLASWLSLQALRPCKCSCVPTFSAPSAFSLLLSFLSAVLSLFAGQPFPQPFVSVADPRQMFLLPARNKIAKCQINCRRPNLNRIFTARVTLSFWSLRPGSAYIHDNLVNAIMIFRRISALFIASEADFSWLTTSFSFSKTAL